MIAICVTSKALMRPTAEMSATNGLIIDQLAEIHWINSCGDRSIQFCQHMVQHTYSYTNCTITSITYTIHHDVYTSAEDIYCTHNLLGCIKCTYKILPLAIYHPISC